MADQFNSKVTVRQGRVRIEFDMPFMPGDECVTVHSFRTTEVDRTPDYHIVLQCDGDGARIRIQAGGDWYTTNHTQQHGVGEFCADREALLEYWLKRPLHYFEASISGLSKLFDNDPVVVKRLADRRAELIREQIDKSKSDMADAIMLHTKNIGHLEAALADPTKVADSGPF